MLAQFRRHFPALAPLLRFQELSTPVTQQHFVRSPDGAMYGIEMSARRLTSRALDVRTPVPGLLLAVAVLAIYGLVGKWETASDQPAFQLASWLTLKLRKPVKPATVRWIFHAVFWIVRWSVLPVLMLPLAGGLVQHRWRGWRSVAVRRSARRWPRRPRLRVLPRHVRASDRAGSG